MGRRRYRPAGRHHGGHRVVDRGAVRRGRGSRVPRRHQPGEGDRTLGTDGTVGDTGLVQDIVPGSDSSNPSGLTAVGPTLYFTTFATGTATLRATDGTPGAARQVFSSAGIFNLRAAGSVLYFTSSDATFGAELWRTDGTTTGMAKDINRNGGTGSFPNPVGVIGTTLVFTADDGTGQKLWRTDGTYVGTAVIGTALPTFGNGTATVGSIMYFAAADAAHGSELWPTDGTVGGTTLAADLFPRTMGSNPTGLTALGSRLLLAADGTGIGREPFAFTAGGGGGGGGGSGADGPVHPVAVGGAADGCVGLVAANGGVTSITPFGNTGTPTRTASADVNGDGVADVVAVTGPGTALRVAV